MPWAAPLTQGGLLVGAGQRLKGAGQKPALDVGLQLAARLSLPLHKLPEQAHRGLVHRRILRPAHRLVPPQGLGRGAQLVDRPASGDSRVGATGLGWNSSCAGFMPPLHLLSFCCHAAKNGIRAGSVSLCHA